MDTSTKAISDILQSKGISPSLHRIKIYQYLMTHRTHPNVDTIYKELVNEIPSLSKTTVYNTVKTLAQKGILLELTIDSTESRYDADIHPHIHFRCTSCGNIYDIEYNLLNIKGLEKLERATIEGHQIHSSHIYLYGICKNCLTRHSKKTQN